MRYTRYNAKYGYISGDGLSDVFNFIKNGFKSLPPSVVNAGKNAVANIATQGITATGDRVGRALANRIAPPPPPPVVGASNKLKEKTVSREEILNDLKLVAPDQYGFGRKIRGKGLKILK